MTPAAKAATADIADVLREEVAGIEVAVAQLDQEADQALATGNTDTWRTRRDARAPLEQRLEQARRDLRVAEDGRLRRLRAAEHGLLREERDEVAAKLAKGEAPLRKALGELVKAYRGYQPAAEARGAWTQRRLSWSYRSLHLGASDLPPIEGIEDGIAPGILQRVHQLVDWVERLNGSTRRGR